MRFNLLFLDASHMRDETIVIFRAWEAGGAVAFHDYTQIWPGVVDVIDVLGLEGTTHGSLFRCRAVRLTDFEYVPRHRSLGRLD
jgi:hypothetical protein